MNRLRHMNRELGITMLTRNRPTHIYNMVCDGRCVKHEKVCDIQTGITIFYAAWEKGAALDENANVITTLSKMRVCRPSITIVATHEGAACCELIRKGVPGHEAFIVSFSSHMYGLPTRRDTSFVIASADPTLLAKTLSCFKLAGVVKEAFAASAFLLPKTCELRQGYERTDEISAQLDSLQQAHAVDGHAEKFAEKRKQVVDEVVRVSKKAKVISSTFEPGVCEAGIASYVGCCTDMKRVRCEIRAQVGRSVVSNRCNCGTIFFDGNNKSGDAAPRCTAPRRSPCNCKAIVIAILIW
jgi:hypothetical protein